MQVEGFKYSDNWVCYWELTTNRTDTASSDVYKVKLNYAFAADVYMFNGVSLQ